LPLEPGRATAKVREGKAEFLANLPLGDGGDGESPEGAKAKPRPLFADLQLQVREGDEVIGFLGVVRSDGVFDGIKGQEGDRHLEHLPFGVYFPTDLIVLR